MRRQYSQWLTLFAMLVCIITQDFSCQYVSAHAHDHSDHDQDHHHRHDSHATYDHDTQVVHDHHDHHHEHRDHHKHFHKHEDGLGDHHNRVHSNENSKISHSASESQSASRFESGLWLEALFATALVGAAPVLVLFIIPLGYEGPEGQKATLRVFLSFAAGGLLGDALLHLLPHSMPSHDHHNHSHSHEEHSSHHHSFEDLSVWLWTIAGMIAFLLMEKVVRSYTGENASHGHSHGHKKHDNESIHQAIPGNNTESSNLRQRKKVLTQMDTETNNESPMTTEKRKIAAAGILNLAADFTHNFTDGLAIGATFVRGSGWQTTLAILIHELPHEIGDFAILIQSGFTRQEAMITQLITAVGAMVGTVVGLLIEGADATGGAAWISPFTAGGFIYIALSSIFPELLEDCSLQQTLKESVAMCVGVVLMVLIALHE